VFPRGHGADHYVPQTAQAVTSFSDSTAQERRHAGDRNGLWRVISLSNTLTIAQVACICRAFIIAVLAMISIGCQNFLFSASAASLSMKLRSLSLRAILRQDSKLVSECRDTLSSSQLFS
jgi:ATP-binding cassette subfamily B (MDR/TAP) protein 1